jgi:hypothetical protein
MIAPGTHATVTPQLEEDPVMTIVAVSSGRAEHA